MISPQYTWQEADSSITLNSIFKEGKNLSFLVGAGLSLAPPSCLPSGHQYTKSVLEKIVPPEEQNKILELMDPERSNMRNQGDFLRFEQIMEYISQSFDKELHVLDPLGQCTRPNFNHIFLAQMILQGLPVFTTNFDSLIEHALLKLGLDRGSILPTIYQKDWEQLSSIEKDIYPVYKLHGSLMDIRDDRDTRNSIQATIAKIAEGKDEGFQLEEWEENVVEPLLEERDVIVLGYSGLDDFDVLPTLWKLNSSKKIFWITHDSNRGIKDAKISIIQQTSNLVSEGDHDRTGDNLLLFMQHKTREMGNIIRISVRTDELLNWLWDRFGTTKPVTINTTPCPKSFNLNLDHLNLSLGEKWRFVGRLYREKDLIPEAISAFTQALRIATEMQDLSLEASILNSLGIINDNNTDYKKAIENYEQALMIYQQLGYANGIATTTCNLAVIYDKNGDYSKAEEMYRKALEMHIENNNLSGQSLDLSNLATMMCKIKRQVDAVPLYQKAIKIHSQIGNVRAKAIDVSNLASTLSALGRKEEAKGFYLDAIALHDQIGNLRAKGIDLSNIGSTLLSLGEKEKSRKYFEDAIEIHVQIENWLSAVIDLNNIGHLFYNSQKYAESIPYYERALEYAKKIDALQQVINIEKYIANAQSKV